MSTESEAKLPMREIILDEFRQRIDKGKKSEDPHTKEFYTNRPEWRVFNSFLNNIHFRCTILEIYSDKDRQMTQLEVYKSHFPKKSTQDIIELLKKQGHSERRINTSQEDFRNDCLEILKKIGIDMEDLDKATERRQARIGGTDTEIEDDFKKIWFPLYIALREMGYSHRDIMI